MKNSETEWIDEVMGSVQDIRRVAPHPDLFERIEMGLDEPIPLSSGRNFLRFAAAAAVLVLALNIFAVQRNFQTGPNPGSEAQVEQSDSYLDLQSNYNLYGQ